MPVLSALLRELAITDGSPTIFYKKAKNPDAYFHRYESQIILYGGAKRMLEQVGINLKALNVNKWAKGYEIKGKTFGEDAKKYISFRPTGQNNFVRGSVRSLGKKYTKERIKERFEQKRKRKVAILKKDYASRKLVDTSGEKFENSPGPKRWATIENLKIAAASYNEVGSIFELEHKISVQTQAGKSAKQSVVELEHRMKDLGEIIKYAEQYRANRSYHIGYKKAKNPDAYFHRYESQIILYGGAKRMLEQVGFNLKSLRIDKLKLEYETLIQQKIKLADTYKKCEKEVHVLTQKLEKLNQYLEQDTALSPLKNHERNDRKSL